MPKYVRKTFTYEGKRYEVSGKTDEEALQKKGKKLDRLERGEVGISKSMLVRVWADTYLKNYINPRIREAGAPKDTRGSMTKKSASMYRQKIDGYIKPAIGNVRIKDVTHTHLQKIVNAQAGKSYSHVDKLILVIQDMFHRAYRDRIILFDPSEDLRMPEVSLKHHRSLTEQERSVFLEVSATHKHGLWAEFHLRFGLRQAEVPPIQVKDLDFKKHLLYVNKAVESGTRAVKEPKTTAGNRSIPIPLEFEPKLKAYVQGKNQFDYLFPSEQGGMMTQSGITRRWRTFKRAMDLAMGAELDSHGKVKPETSKIAADLTMHCLRHTYCTDLAEKGVDASIGRFVTGHADVATLSNIYTHSNEAIIQRIADRINGIGASEDRAQEK